MKIFRLVNAELRKIFLRPTIFVMIAMLVLCSFVSLLAFHPDSRSRNSSITTKGLTVGDIYSNFTQNNASTSFTTKIELDSNLEASLSNVKAFTQKDEVLKTLVDVLGVKDESYEGQSLFDYNALMPILEDAARQQGGKVFEDANKLLDNFKKSLGKTIDAFNKFYQSKKYYLASTKFEEVKDMLQKLDEVVDVPKVQEEKVYKNLLTLIRDFEFDEKMPEFVQSIDEIMISEEQYNQIKENYYSPAKLILGDQTEKTGLMGKIVEFYEENQNEDSQDYIEEFKGLLSDYKAYVNLTCESIDSALKLEISNDISDRTMQTYLGYYDFNRLIISSTLQKNSYIIKNQINPRTTLEAMNFGVNSGDETNAWDFVCFAMNITSLLIIVFCVIICSKIIAGEQASGTMKMLAIRPFTRNKILGGKLLATMYFSMIFVIFSFIVNLSIGWAFYGLPNQMMIGVFNGSSVVYAHPLVFCLFLILSLFLKVFIYVSIATMISVFFRSYTGSSMVSFAIVIITLILNGVLGTKYYFKYFPMANFDIYKYFSCTQSAAGFKAIFSSPQIIDTSFVFTFVYAIIMIVLLNGFSFLLFNKKDIA